MNQKEAVALAIQSILRDGCSDITDNNLESSLISEFKEEFENFINQELNKGSISDMGFRPLQHILTPKNRFVFDYRKAAIISPSCLAKYLALVLQYAELVESKRVPLDKNVVFSCRFHPTSDGIFDKDVNYSKWRENTKERVASKEYNFLVSCDIAAFYDRVNIHRIESTLDSIGVDKQLVKKTNELLLFWSKKDSYGLPIGNIASRILAEVALIDIDSYLLNEGIVFTRYVDDYRFFAPDLLTAQNWMNKLTMRLFRDGLMLNTGKTQIKKIKDDSVSTFIEEDKHDQAEVVIKEINKLIGGYNKISRKFIMPAEEKYEAFKNIDIDLELSNLEEKSIVEFSGIQQIIIAVIVQKKFFLLGRIAQICFSYLYGLDYFIDMLLKNAEFIPLKERDELADLFAELIESGKLYSFEWHSASVAKLLSNKNYFRKKALLKLFTSPAKDVLSTYASIIALEGLESGLDRTDFRTIREYFERSDEWEKRRLLFLSKVLPTEEKKAWGKAMRPTILHDFLSLKLCEKIIKGQH